MKQVLPPISEATPAVAFCFLLNRLLQAEPWARARLAPFAGETLELRASPLPTLRFAIAEGGTVQPASAEPGLVMTLNPGILAALARGEGHALREVGVEGNTRLAAEALVLARHLRWDAEEGLSRIVGDVAAHRLAEAGRALAAWHLDAAGRLAAAFADYATEEKRILAHRADLDSLAESLARLRDSIARLDKRLETLR